VLGNVVRDVGTPREQNGDLIDDQTDGQSRGGETPARNRRRRATAVSDEKGRGRNLKIPDSLYDQLVIHARRTKVKEKRKRQVDGVNLPDKEYFRSLTTSEACCRAIRQYLAKTSAADTEPDRDPSPD
jgi:hypothetical protein